jgi:alcohol dehydrogenase (cytochrome c)
VIGTRRSVAWWIVSLVGVLSLRVHGQVTSERLAAAPSEPQNWLTYSGNYSSTRYSPLNQITPANVRNLKIQWVYQSPVAGNWQTTPLVVDGMMYITQRLNDVVALDAATGRAFWIYRYTPAQDRVVCCGANNRGLAILGDTLFMGTLDAQLIAIDRRTGRVIWKTEVATTKSGYSITHAPLVVKNKVIVGVGGGEYGIRGFIAAYDVTTGREAWRFYTIPAPGEPGSETWERCPPDSKSFCVPEAWKRGGGSIWMTGSYDPQLNLTYWGVGNVGPDYNGAQRPGDNLYTDSVVALDADTGKLKWHYQFTPHDTHDWDATQPVVLIDEMWQGRPRKLLVHGDRNGMFYVLDRTNGEFLLGSNLSTKITWNKGFTKEGRPIVDPAAVATKEGIALCPGPNGGANWPDVSYSPMTKLFYVRVADSCGISTSSDDPLTGNRWFGEIKPDPPKAQEALAALMEGYPGGNFLRAMSPFTGKKVWDYAIAGGRTGPLSTGGGLVFIGASGGLVALDAKTGKPVWNVNIGQSSLSSPITYMVGGKQYLALPGTGVVVGYTLR